MGALREALRELDARTRTIAADGSPAHEARYRGKVVIAAVTHDFRGGWRPHVRSSDPYQRRFRQPDPMRCRFCGRPSGHVVHDDRQSYVETLTSIRPVQS